MKESKVHASEFGHAARYMHMVPRCVLVPRFKRNIYTSYQISYTTYTVSHFEVTKYRTVVNVVLFYLQNFVIKIFGKQFSFDEIYNRCLNRCKNRYTK